MTHATSTTQPMTREQFDALLRTRIDAMIEQAHSETDQRGLPRGDTLDDAVLLEAQARELADAIDRAELDLRYDDAVVITGSQGVVVVSTDDYDAERVYWESRAGEVDSLTVGAKLVAFLRDGQQ